MHELKSAVEAVKRQDTKLPFSIITSITDQYISNVPIFKPTLICVLGGLKELGNNLASCRTGDFIFLSNTPNVHMRNISQQDSSYFALMIEFEYSDFEIFETSSTKSTEFFSGAISPTLQFTLQQFVEWSVQAPELLWPARRRELLQLIHLMGFQEVANVVEPPSLSHRIEKIISASLEQELSAEDVARRLAMSDSTLRRKLSAENTNFQAIKDRVKLGNSLYLLQTTDTPVGLVAEKCGYKSQSRFTEKFKNQYGLTPSELRKTRFLD